MNNLIVVGKNSNIVVKNFDTIDEFQQYYNLHKDEVDKLTTTKLNRMFKIKDHKITRRTIAGNDGKTLCFRQLFKSELSPAQRAELTDNVSKEPNKDSNKDVETHVDESRFDELENNITELNSKIKSMEVDIIKIKNQLLEIIRVINEQSN